MNWLVISMYTGIGMVSFSLLLVFVSLFIQNWNTCNKLIHTGATIALVASLVVVIGLSTQLPPDNFIDVLFNIG